MRILLYHVNETPANALNSGMCATARSPRITSSLRIVHDRLQDLLRLLTKLVI